MKRVVADTNILVSAVQFGGKPKQLLDLALDRQVDLAISEAIIAETLRVLEDKFDRAPGWLTETERQLRVITRLVQPTESFHVIEAHPTDDRILECAVAAEAEVIVSGDHPPSEPKQLSRNSDPTCRRVPRRPAGPGPKLKAYRSCTSWLDRPGVQPRSTPSRIGARARSRACANPRRSRTMASS